MLFTNTSTGGSVSLCYLLTHVSNLNVLTWVRLLGLTAQFSDTVAVAVTLVQDPANDFVPGFSDLIERSGLRLLALICGQSKTKPNDATQSSHRGPSRGTAAALLKNIYPRYSEKKS